MTSLEDELKDLREKNNELVQKVQYWKMTAAQRENEKLELMKEINDLRLKLSRLRSGGAAHARKLDAALQSASEEALSHLVQASGAVARTIELAKSYMRDRQELDDSSPRWSNISGTPNVERVHRVLPLMMGGQSIQPVVSLSRTLLNTSNPRSTSRSPNPNRSITERAVPMHMLQDVYIPLTRIDANDFPVNSVDTENNMEDSAEDLGLEDDNDRSLEDSQNLNEDEYEASRRLDAVTEDFEPEDEIVTPPRSRYDNPLEGPSWLLDAPANAKTPPPRAPPSLEPDSTTELDATTEMEVTTQSPPTTPQSNDDAEKENEPVMKFSPTIRRRKRPSTPPPTPSRFSQRPVRRLSNSGRILKVVVAKMKMESSASPAKRQARRSSAVDRRSPVSGCRSPVSGCRSPMSGCRTPVADRRTSVRFDAPSPNGSTNAGLIVSENIQNDSATCGPGGDTNVSRDKHCGLSRGSNWVSPNESLASNSVCDGDGLIQSNSCNVTLHDNHSVTPLDSRSVKAHESSNIMQRDSSRVTTRDSFSVMSRDSHSVMLRDSHSVMLRDSHSVISRDSHDSDSGGERNNEGRTRRPRKAITYKEKPLNRKMRR